MGLTVSELHRDLLRLHLVPGLGPRLTAALLERFGSARQVLRAQEEELCEVPHIGQKLAHDLQQAFLVVDLGPELELIERYRVQLLALGTEAYPLALAQIPDAPHLLYVRGTYQAADANAVAIVGSRHGTSYGRRVAERLTKDLVRAGFTIVSGLARGIDGAAHRTALQSGGRTIAVLAGGLSRIYPPEHAELAEEIEKSGALFSEAAMGMEPLAGMFPARNRLISGLSRGVVIVEAAERSGALITARHAAEQGRSVFAVPGPVDSPASGGTLRLLREGATLVRSAADIVEDLDGVAPAAPTSTAAMPADLDEDQRRVWECLAGQPRHTDEIVQSLSWTAARAAGVLLALEMKRAVRRLPGNRYERS
jgi:DNA processing protein